MSISFGVPIWKVHKYRLTKHRELVDLLLKLNVLKEDDVWKPL